MLRIVFKDRETKMYGADEFTDYEYDQQCFIVTKDGQWIGIYNIDCIACIEYMECE